MCGRYIVYSRPDHLRQSLEKSSLKSTKWIDQEKYRSSYNVAPCHFQPVVRIDYDSRETILHTMRWGLIPSWTKTKPEFSKLIINCRDDSLSDGKSLFNSMKNRKRCIVIADGFYEWLKKGNQRIPYFVKRKDGNLFLFAGLYDSVKFEDEENSLYTYTIITTTSASTSIEFLHDRMPAILENGSEELSTWLDPRTPWCPELARLLKPFTGELEFYPVSDDVGKVSNNSPDLITPLDEKRSKNSIANFFKKKQEIKEENDVPIIPAKRSSTSDDEMTNNMETKTQENETSIKEESMSTPSSPTKAFKKSLESTPKKRTSKKKKVDNVKETEKITSYFTKTSP
ncbi:hypothetical protein RclHR1_08940006 [Rhizophagus clarus]|uniref:DUF159-domain-containing protein n=1 Tax=Rhizophagus clarus TaxID=94130 RepID=A0A2Z6S4V9_9GLOM|nr:hypothetical protein RclHR1_08940006 [Rhizophagus clarus]GES94592.1 DUF159-domain-containing protein [Rhizophagus clarus]